MTVDVWSVGKFCLSKTLVVSEKTESMGTGLILAYFVVSVMGLLQRCQMMDLTWPVQYLAHSCMFIISFIVQLFVGNILCAGWTL